MTVLKFPDVRDFLNQDVRKTFFDNVVEDTKFSVTTFKDFRPTTDIVEAEDRFMVLMALPGVDKDDLKVELLGRRLVVRGEAKLPEGFQGLRFSRREIKRGNFARSFFLPEHLDTNSIDASFKDGILTLTLRKLAESPEAAATTVEVN